jgi:hypothetical protein
VSIPITLECTQGQAQTFSRQTPNADGSIGGLYSGSETITATVWPMDSQASVLSVTGFWTNAALTQWGVTLTNANTSTLSPGIYNFAVNAPTSVSGETGRLFRGFLEVTSFAGSSAFTLPDLITGQYCFKQLGQLTLTGPQQEIVPDLIHAASWAVRRYCQGRIFSLNTYVEWSEVELDGTIRLKQVPVQVITRIQGPQQQALNVSNTSSSVQYSQAYFAYSGQIYDNEPLTPTGITLNWADSGTITNSTVSYTTGMTVNGLAAAIAAVGGGWTALATSTYGLWPVTELCNGFVAQGTSQSAQPASGANFNVALDMGAQVPGNPHTGIYSVGRQIQNTNAGMWGPGGESLWGDSSQRQRSVVKVSYTAGETTIPAPVQFETSQLVKYYLERGVMPVLRAEEKAADYSYKLAEDMLSDMPRSVRQGLSRYVLHFA